MNLLSLIDRLLTQRPLAFLGSNDRYLLPNLTSGSEGFEAIGTDRQQPPLLLKNYLSYDEMKISALISLSSWSVFVNNGRKKNYGHADRAGTFQEDGMIVGQVGARLKREGVMDYVDCVIKRTENTPDKGFGGNNQWHANSVFDKLWGKPLPTFDNANRAFLSKRDGKPILGEFEIITIGKELLFNVTVYKKRILIPAESLLCEANTRARAAGKKAYVHVVGLGLGVWRAFNKQEELFVEAWGDALRNITNTEHIAHVDFSYIDSYAVHGIKDGEIFPNTDIKIHFSKRDLYDKVPEDCILVCSYDSDGNSLPGNDFWMGKMCSTGASAAACSSCVAEIHNHLFNPLVSGDTLRVATRDGYLLSWQDYLAQSTGASPKQCEVKAMNGAASLPLPTHIAKLSSSSLLSGGSVGQCVICEEVASFVRFEPCGHSLTCEECCGRVKRCLDCHAVVVNKVLDDGSVFSNDQLQSAEQLRYLEIKVVNIEEAQRCVICQERPRGMVFLCGHSACAACASTLSSCHMCRETIKKKIILF